MSGCRDAKALSKSAERPTPTAGGATVDEFAAAQASLKRAGTPGWWDRVVPQLEEARRESLLRAAANADISHRAISMVLAGWGFEVSGAQVGHWRRTHV
jgi:hypothetical protein